MIWLPAIGAATVLTAIAAWFIARARHVVVNKLPPLSTDDRLRISLAIRSLEDAERELRKVAWVNGRPGHPAIAELLLDLSELEARARRLLRVREN